MDLFPQTAAINPDGCLSIAGHDLTELAARWGTPLYVYDAETIRAQVVELQALARQHYPGASQLTYAAKAYFSLGMARRLAALGLGVDVVSMGELKIAQKAGFAPGIAHLHGNNKSARELEAAARWGVQSIVVDSLEELEFLDGLTDKLDLTARIWLRVTPGIHVDTHAYRQTAHPASKFGLPVSDGQAAEGIRRARESQRLRLTGLHTHLGSQVFEAEPYRRAVAALFELAQSQGFVMDEISPGGGWGVRYTDADSCEGVETWVQAVAQAVVEQARRFDVPLPKLVLEPGRLIVARAGVALYTVGTHKTASDGTRIVAVDGGLADNPRPALYQADYTALLANRADATTTQTASVVGKFCESGDRLIAEVQLPEVKRGDVLVMPAAGAYQLSMASNYNLADRPAVLWLERGEVQVLQNREQIDESGWWVEG
jgi:diaminopimelate decarboxylase